MESELKKQEELTMGFHTILLPAEFNQILFDLEDELLSTNHSQKTVDRIRNLFSQDIVIGISCLSTNEKILDLKYNQFTSAIKEVYEKTAFISFDESEFIYSLKDYLFSIKNKLRGNEFNSMLNFVFLSNMYRLGKNNYYGITLEEMQEGVELVAGAIRKDFQFFKKGVETPIMYESIVLFCNNGRILKDEQLCIQLVKRVSHEREEMLKGKIRNGGENKKRDPIDSRLRHEVFKRDEYACKECNAKGKQLHVDHILPVSQGGTDELFNLQTLCVDCNLAKANKYFVSNQK